MTINLNKLSSVCIKNIFLIYLSFFQEYVDSVENWELKDKLLNLKYYEAFTKLEIGNLLIEHKFHVSRENYVDLYLIADILKIGDMDSYDIIFKE